VKGRPPMATPPQPYPVRLDVMRRILSPASPTSRSSSGPSSAPSWRYPTSSSLLLGLVASIIYFIATFAILFTGKYPEGMYNFTRLYALEHVRERLLVPPLRHIPQVLIRLG
jgi:hypothetical protein